MTDWPKQLEKIQKEIESNVKTTKELREKIKPIKQEIMAAKELGNDEEAKQKADALAAFDKTFNKLRSDFYFLNAEMMKAQAQIGAN